MKDYCDDCGQLEWLCICKPESDTKPESYYSTCESCDTVLVGTGEYHAGTNTLHGNPCPKCGADFIVSGWLDEEEGDE